MLRPRGRHQQEEGSRCLPSLGALVTDEAERLCCKNGGLLFHELLSAFSTSESAVPFRSGSHILQLQDFRIQFVRARDMAPRPAQLAEARLYEAFSLRENTEEAQRAWLSMDDRQGGAVVEVREREDINAALLVNETQMPWYGRFRSTLRQSLQYTEPVLLGCPAAMLLVVASSDPSPIERFQELSSPQSWPLVFQNGQYSLQEVSKIYVLLHDEAEGLPRDGIAQAAEILRQMKVAFPAAPCKLLRINSLAAETPNLQQADIWRLPLEQLQQAAPMFLPDSNDPRLRYPPVSAVRGCCLSSDDMLNLQEFVSELTLKIVIPAMERRIFTLQANVAQSRKGMKNFVKSFWRKPRDAGASGAVSGDDGSGGVGFPGGGGAGAGGAGGAGGMGNMAGAAVTPVLYRHERIEAQIRLLADTCFVMQDYDTALSNYKLVRDDFKSDKAWLHLGSVYEMMALCYYHMGGAGAGGDVSTPGGSSSTSSGMVMDGRYRRDMEAAIEEAVKAYFRRADEEASSHFSASSSSAATTTRISGQDTAAAGGGGGSGARMATRASLIGAELFLLANPPKAVDAANLLINAAHKESALCAAVLVEQAAWAYLKGGNMRKFAFYMSMAGQTFLSCQQQERHAVRCYASALGLFEESGWRHILDHVHFTLGRQFLRLQYPERALYHLLKLLLTTRGSRGEQAFPQVQQQLVQEVLQICRERPQALAAIAPYWEGGARVLLSALSKAQTLPPPPPPPYPPSSSPSSAATVVVPKLTLPRILEETLRVTQGMEEPQGEEVKVLKEDLQRELKTAAIMGEKGGSMREWVRAMGKVAKEEIRMAALAGDGGAAAAAGGIRWRGRDEPVTVSVEVMNPLQIPLVLSEMQVTAAFDEATHHTQHQPSPVSAASALEVETQEVQLAPLERKQLILLVKPLRCGLLRVTGLRWKLFGELWGSTEFESPGPLLQDTLEKRASRARGPNLRLVSRIVPELPLLEAELEGLPQTMFQGEMVQASLKITNRGLAPATHIYAKSNLPSWLFMRDPHHQQHQHHQQQQSSAPLSSRGSSSVCMSMVGVSGTVFRVLTGTLLAKGATVRVPVWVRGLGGGKQTLRILVRYERHGALATASSSAPAFSSALISAAAGEEYRYTEVSQDVCVLPSVSMTPSVSPSYACPGECVLSLNVSNYRTDGDAREREVVLHSVIALSRLWKLEPIGGGGGERAAGGVGGAAGAAATATTAMAWQERTTLHYRLVPLEKEGDPVVYEHELQSGNLHYSPAASSSSSSSSYAMGILDDGFLSPSSAAAPSTSSTTSGNSSWASLDFLYVENASQAYRTAREEANRREAVSAAGAGGAGGAPQERAPLSLGEIKRKEAEKKAREATEAAAAAAATTTNPSHTKPFSSSGERPKSPKLGMGMEGSAGHGGHLAALVPRGRATLNLLLTWRVEERTSTGQERVRVGQHQVLNHAVRPLTLDPTTAAPLTITVSYPPSIQGRLGPGGGGLLQKCHADVLVTVHNRMTDLAVDFVFEALSAPSGKRQSANKAAASPSFLWLGCTNRCVKGLQAGASVQLPVRVAFLRAGVYDLNRFRFVVHMPANSAQLVPGVVNSRTKLLHGNMVRVPYIFSAQYVIKVSASAPASLAPSLMPEAAAEEENGMGGGGLVQRFSSALGVAQPHQQQQQVLQGGTEGESPEKVVQLVERQEEVGIGSSSGSRGEKGGEEGQERLSPPPLLEADGHEFLEDVETATTPLNRSLPGTRDNDDGQEMGMDMQQDGFPISTGTSRRQQAEEEEAEAEAEVEVGEDQSFNPEGQDQARQMLELEEPGGEEEEEQQGEGRDTGGEHHNSALGV